MIKMTKGKKRILKGSKRKTESHMQGNQLLANFSEENLQARGDCNNIFSKKGKPRIHYSKNYLSELNT